MYVCCNHGSRASQTCLNTPFLIISIKAKPLQVKEAQWYICMHVINLTLLVISTYIGELALVLSKKLRNRKPRKNNSKTFQPRFVESEDSQVIENYFDLF